MSNDVFDFKQFRLKQDRCAMKVGTDAVLIGAWVDARNCQAVLDIGTGTGIISLMIAQRSNAQITALEIDQHSYKQALENVASSSFHKRIEVIHQSFQQYARQTNKKFDLIVSNPPYFVDSLKSSDSYRSIARHADSLPFIELLDGVYRCLDPKGRFCLILPKKEAAMFCKLTEEKGLYLVKILRVKSSKAKEEDKRLIMEFSFSEKELTEDFLYVREASTGEYSEQYRQLTHEYHLNF